MMNSKAALALLPVCWILACALDLPPAPQNVKLVSEDFYSSLSWLLDPAAASSEFEVQICASGSESGFKWTQVNVTCEKMNISWRCNLSPYFQELHNIYWARVRTVHGDSTSDWTVSNELNHYRDVTLGPPEMQLQVKGLELQVDVGTRLTPFQNENGTLQRVHEVLRKIKCDISIYEGPRKVDDYRDSSCSGRILHTYGRPLKGKTLYCVHVQLTFHERKVSNGSKCTKTSSAPPDFLSVGLVLGCVVVTLIILASTGLFFVIKHVHPDSARIRTPRMLQVVKNEDTKVAYWSPGPGESLKVDFISLDPIEELLPEGMSETAGERRDLQPLPGEYDFRHNHGYHSISAPASSENMAYTGTSFSWPSSQEGLGAAGLWEDCGSSTSEPIVHGNVPVHPAWPSSSLKVNAGSTVYIADTQDQNPASPQKAESALYRGVGKAQRCPPDIPLDSVQLQTCLGVMDEPALGDLFDSGSDESTEVNSLDSQNVTSCHEDSPLLHRAETSEDVSICSCRPQDQPLPGYEPRANVFPI